MFGLHANVQMMRSSRCYKTGVSSRLSLGLYCDSYSLFFCFIRTPPETLSGPASRLNLY